MNTKTIARCVIMLSVVFFVGASCQKTSDAGVYRTEDAGQTWEKRVYVGKEKKKTITISGIDVETLDFDPENHSTIYLASKENGVYKTENSGEQWRHLNMGSGRVPDMAIDPNEPETLYVLRGNTILKSTTAGEEWTTLYTDTQQATLLRITIDDTNTRRIYAATSIGTLLLSEDAGETWRVLYQVNEPIVGVHISPTNHQTIYLVELDKAVHKSTDGGQTWVDLFESDTFEALADEKKEYESIDDVKQMTIDPRSGDVLYIVTESGLFKSTNGGETWQPLQTLIAFGAQENERMDNVVIDPNDSNTIQFSVGKLIHKTTDGGQTWFTINTFPSSGRISFLLIDPTNTDMIYAGVQKVQQKRSWFQIQPTKQ